jgi:hypothetical protein
MDPLETPPPSTPLSSHMVIDHAITKVSNDLIFWKETAGESHDQADAEWIVIRTQLRGHNDTPFGRPALGQPPAGRPAGRLADRGLAALWAYLVCFSYY